MIKINRYEKLIYTNENGNSIEFDTINSDFRIVNENLNEVNSNIIAKQASSDGEIFESSSIAARHIVIEGVIKDSNRNKCRRILTTLVHRQKGKLTYINNYENITRYIECYIEKTPLITGDLLPKFLIYLYCPSPFWEGEPYSIEINNCTNINPKFEFEFDDEFELGEIDYKNVNIVNDGDVPAGFIATLYANGEVINPIIKNTDTNEFLKLNITMEKGEKIRIDTRINNKSIVRIKDNDEDISCFEYLDPESTFLKINNGECANFYIYAERNGDFLEATLTQIDQFILL